MKRLILILACLNVVACSSPKPKGYVLPPALREVFRGGELKPLQNAESTEGMPNAYDQVSHTCTSTPIFHLDGTYARTDVRCW